jgi:UDP-2,3-diacylglucosamine hydrolase
MTSSKEKLYFVSDAHLGVPNFAASLERERLLIRLLEEAEKDAAAIYIVGDLFDFWFEYKHAIPKGHVRILGKLADLCDKGIPVHLFTGNHDMWLFDYLPKEIGVQLHREPITFTHCGKRFLVGHGDGLGPGDYGYKLIKRIFASKICQWLFARIHPNAGIGIANYWSRKSRKSTGTKDAKYLGKENEWLVHYCEEYLQSNSIDYFVFGHRHLPLEVELSNGSRYINLGDWITYFSYAVVENDEIHLLTYPEKEPAKRN